jgi:multiple sugar transport system substrate-binding protein
LSSGRPAGRHRRSPILDDFSLDRNSATPIAAQLEHLLRDRIASGELGPEERLPTEMDLCEQLGISRTTVRRALGQLTARGLLVRYPGRGTFVAPGAWDRHEETGVVELTVMVSSERRCWLLQQAAASWNRDYPARPVRLRFEIASPDRYHDRIAAAVGRGVAPDILMPDSVWVAEYANRGYIVPFPEAGAGIADAIADDLFPPLRDESTIGGDLYALPAEADFAVLWYRKDWFAAEGIVPPATWEEWRSALDRFRTPAARRAWGLGPFPLAFAGGETAEETTTFQLLGVLWSAGGDVISGGEVVLDGPAARAAVAFVADLVHSRHVPERVTDEPSNGPALAFAGGAAAMALGGTYEGALIREAAGWTEQEFLDRAGFVPVPAGPGGAPATVLGGLSYVISRQSRNPDVALSLLRRTMDPGLLLESARRSGQNPATTAATARLDPAQDVFMHEAAGLFAHARARWTLPEYARVSAQIAAMFERAILGEATPAEAVADAAVAIGGISGLPLHGRRTGAHRTGRGARAP